MRCACKHYARTAGGGDLDAFEQKARDEYPQHIAELEEAERERARLRSMWAKATKEEARWITSEPAPIRAKPGGALPKRDDTPYPVVHLKDDGTALLHPRGYKNGRVQVLPPLMADQQTSPQEVS